MLRLRILPGFKLANGDGRERPFDDFLADYNLIMLTHSVEAAHGPVPELLRRIVADGQGVEGVTVRGIHIRSRDDFCDQCSRPHVVSQNRDLVTICDSGGMIRRLWGVESDAWLMVINAGRIVIDHGPFTEIERLAMQFIRNVVLSAHSIARAPPALVSSVQSLETRTAPPPNNLAITEQAAVKITPWG